VAKPIERRNQCCLCGKTKEQVRKLIVGLHGAVCSDCIDLCEDILHNDRSIGSPYDRPAPDWDGSVIVSPEDRDVFPNPVEARRGLSMVAALIRSYVLSVVQVPTEEQSS